MAKQIQATSFFFSQYLRKEFWERAKAMPDKKFDEFFNNVGKFGDLTTKRFKESGHEISRVAVIKHDKDMRSDGTKKPQHIHIFLEFKKKVDLNVVARVLGLKPNYVIPTKRGRYGKENALAYLVHAKQPEKHQYDKKEVWCNGCKDKSNGKNPDFASGWYQAYYDEHVKSWQMYSAKAEREAKEIGIDLAIKQILEGKYANLDQFITDDDSYSLYVNHKNEIQTAFETLNKRKALKFAKQLTSGEVEKKVIFISGLPGRGKTRFSYQLAQALKVIHPDWQAPFVGGGNHPWDTYMGQEIAILDDFRVNQFSADEWVHYLDPHYNNATMNARYNDKSPAFHVLIITNYQDPITFFNYMKENEDISQFLRRITYNVTILNAKDFNQTDLQLTGDNQIDANESDDDAISLEYKASKYTAEQLPTVQTEDGEPTVVLSDFEDLGLFAKYRTGKNGYGSPITWLPVPLYASSSKNALNILVMALQGKINKRDLIKTMPYYRQLSDVEKGYLLLANPENKKTDSKPLGDDSESDDDELPF